MKTIKPILSFLAAVLFALCPPTMAQAQTAPVTNTDKLFSFSSANLTDGNITLGKRVKAALPGEDPTDLSLSDESWDASGAMPLTGDTRYGWGQIVIKSTQCTDELIIDFDFSECSTTGSKPLRATNMITPDGYFSVAKGTKIRFSLKSGNRIKSIKPAGINADNLLFLSDNAVTTAVMKSKMPVIESFESNAASTDFDITAITTAGKTNKCVEITISNSTTYGSKKPIVLKVVDGVEMGQLVDNDPEQNRLKFWQFKVTYVEDPDHTIPDYDTELTYGKKYLTPILYREATTGVWKEATGTKSITSTASKVQVKLGEAVTTFIKPGSTTAKTGQYTVLIDPGKRTVGTTINAKFYTELDPDLLASGDNKQIYSVEYFYDYVSTDASDAYKNISGNISTTLPTAVNKFGSYIYSSPNIICAAAADAGLTSTNSTFTVKSSVSKNPLSGSTTSSNFSTINTGKAAAVYINGIRIKYMSNATPVVQPTLPPKVVFPTTVKQNATTGVYNSTDEFDIEVAPASSDIYTNGQVYYIFSEEPVADFSKAEATLAEGGKIHIDKSGYLAVRTFASAKAQEAASAVLSYQIMKYDFKNIKDYSELSNKDNAGKQITLQFPLQTIASGYFKTNNKEYVLITRDTIDNPVRIVHRGSTILSTVSPTSKLVGYQSTTSLAITSQTFIPAGAVKGELEFDEQGRPIVVITDIDNGKDYLELCTGGGSTVTVMKNQQDYARYTYTANRRTSISADDFARVINIDANYDATTKKFTVEGATEPLDVRVTTSTGFLVNIPANTYKPVTLPTAAGKYTLCGIVWYDSATDSYYLMPRAITAVLGFPGLTTADIANGTIHNKDLFNEADDKRSASTYLEMIGNKFKVNLTGTTSNQQFYFYQFNNPDTHKLLIGSVAGGNSGSSTAKEVTEVALRGDEPLEVRFYITNTDATNNLPYAISEPYLLNVYDVLTTAPVYNSVSDVIKAAKENPEELNGTYVHIKSPAMALSMIKDNKSKNSAEFNSILVKDITPLKEGNSGADLECLPIRFNEIVRKYPVKYFPNDYTTEIVSVPMAPGDSIADLTVKLSIDENGNITGDISRTPTFYRSYKYSFHKSSSPGYRRGMREGEPFFINYLEAMNSNPVFDKPAQQQLSAANIDKVVTLAGVKVEKHTDATDAAGEISTQADEAVAYVAKMKDEVLLQWNVFPSAETRSLNHAIIDQLAETCPEATFTLTGLVRSAGEAGQFIEVIDFAPDFSKVLAVCDHPNHHTHRDKQDITDDMLEKAVMLKGMKVKSSGSVYLTDTKQPVVLNFAAVSDKQAAWKTDASNAVTDSHEIKVTGILHATEGDTPAAPYTIDVNTFETIDPKLSTNELRLTFNGRNWIESLPDFYSSGKLGYKAPEGSIIYYTLVNEPDKVEFEVADDATEAEKTAAHEEAIKKILNESEETLFSEDTDLTCDHTMWIKLFSCAPGESKVKEIIVKVEKQSKDINTIQELIDGDGTKDRNVYYHNRSPWLVTNTAPDRVIVTDGSGLHAALWVNDTRFALPKAGSYVSDFAVAKGNAATLHPDYTYKFDVIDNDSEKSTVAAPATPIEAPQAKEVAAVTADDHKGMLVGLTDVKIEGSKATGFHIKQSAGSEIAFNNILRIKLDSIVENSDAELYHVIGYAMLRNNVEANDIEAQPAVELWPVDIVRRRVIATPTITLSSDKSLEPATALITCPEEGALIEYSLDGGNTWIPYTEAVTLNATTSVSARATKAYLTGSTVATATFTRLHKSAKPKADFAVKPGATTVTLDCSDPAVQAFRLYYTLDGSEPTEQSTAYSAPFEVTQSGVVLKAILFELAEEAVQSDILEADVPYTAPVVTPEEPERSAKVQIRQRVDGSAVWVELAAPAGLDVEAIYYTLDGTVPGETSAVYTSEIKVEKNLTVKAALKERGKTLGEVVEADIVMPSSAIDGIDTDNSGKVTVEGSSIIAPEGSEAYDLSGRRVPLTGLRQGVYIVRLPGGSTVKVAIR